MTEEKISSDKFADLRQRAEEMLQRRPEELREMPPEDIQHLIHELEVHQVELELQNQELRRTQLELELSRDRYLDLYDFAPVGYFTLSAEGLILQANLTAVTMLGVERGRLIKQPLTRFIAREDQDVYYLHRKQLFETQEPQACEMRMVRKKGSQFWARIEAAVARDSEGQAVCRTTMSDVTERKRAEEELRQSYAQLRRTLEGTVNVLVSAIEVRDAYAADHQRQVTRLACAIAREMGLPEEQIEGIRVAGLIHDIGEISIPLEVLSKPTKLTELEDAMMKAHPQVSHDIVKAAEFPWPVADIVLQHHERLDGSGYPQGLSGEEIILEARILAIADVVMTIVSHRPHQRSCGLDKALEEISQNRGVLYDPEVVDACLRLFTEKGFEFEQEPVEG